MSIWKRLFGGRTRAGEAPPAKRKQRASPSEPIPLPSEPYVFECRACGKVFDSRRRRDVRCPECDAGDVELLG